MKMAMQRKGRRKEEEERNEMTTDGEESSRFEERKNEEASFITLRTPLCAWTQKQKVREREGRKKEGRGKDEFSFFSSSFLLLLEFRTVEWFCFLFLRETGGACQSSPFGQEKNPLGCEGERHFPLTPSSCQHNPLHRTRPERKKEKDRKMAPLGICVLLIFPGFL